MMLEFFVGCNAAKARDVGGYVNTSFGYPPSAWGLGFTYNLALKKGGKAR
jgi:hypothetical protein